MSGCSLKRNSLSCKNNSALCECIHLKICIFSFQILFYTIMKWTSVFQCILHTLLYLHLKIELSLILCVSHAIRCSFLTRGVGCRHLPPSCHIRVLLLLLLLLPSLTMSPAMFSFGTSCCCCCYSTVMANSIMSTSISQGQMNIKQATSNIFKLLLLLMAVW